MMFGAEMLCATKSSFENLKFGVKVHMGQPKGLLDQGLENGDGQCKDIF